jgi:hypothetical protein
VIHFHNGEMPLRLPVFPTPRTLTLLSLLAWYLSSTGKRSRNKSKSKKPPSSDRSVPHVAEQDKQSRTLLDDDGEEGYSFAQDNSQLGWFMSIWLMFMLIWLICRKIKDKSSIFVGNDRHEISIAYCCSTWYDKQHLFGPVFFNMHANESE